MIRILSIAAIAASMPLAALAAPCPGNPDALGTERVLMVDADSTANFNRLRQPTGSSAQELHLGVVEKHDAATEALDSGHGQCTSRKMKRLTVPLRYVKDYSEAVKWYRLAANQGNAHALCALGSMHLKEQGVPSDYAEALKFYRLAADYGDGFAQNTLGIMYSKGELVPQEYVSAYMWLSLAAAQGVYNAEERRDRVAKKMPPAQIAEAQKLAREWKPIKKPPQ
jgi:hypothetical protein